jgi:hypothetical protein
LLDLFLTEDLTEDLTANEDGVLSWLRFISCELVLFYFM